MEQFLKKFEQRLAMNRAAFDAAKAGFRRGMSEQQIKQLILARWDQPAMEFSGDICADGRIEGDATPYILKEGDALILDLQPGWDGCYADTTRTFFIGAPSQQQKEAYAAVLAALKAMEQVLATHPRACEVYNAMQAELQRFGLCCPHHAGHAVGMEKFLQPQLIAENPAQLEPGMIITLEPGVYFENRFGIRIENNYLLTEDGMEELFQYPLTIENFII